MKSTRRHVLRLAAGSLALPLAAHSGLAAPKMIGRAKAKLVVVGGGAGGTTLARAVQKDAAGAIEVTLVETQKSYTTPFFSNLFIGGYRTLGSLTFSYDKLRQEGVTLALAPATSIDRDNKDLILAGRRVPYDRLVLAPGIELKYDSVPGYSETAALTMPHAWKSGAQAELLAKKLNALSDGDTVVVIAPPNPARCPPAVYERVSMFAHVLKGKGHTKSKIVVLDTKPSFPLQPVFQESWEKYFPGMIEWQDPQMHGGIKRVDPKTGEVVTDLASYKAALANVIPAQFAPRIASAAGLTDDTGFCPIDADTMKSSVDRNIYVLGDACASGDMPKSAFSAVSQAKVAAQVIRGELADARPVTARYATSCWSMLETDDSVKIGGTYEARGGRIRQVTSELSQTGEAAGVRKKNDQDASAWYAAVTTDMFG
ncbi:MAG: sulfide dehydrogenase [flavocytochrome c] flavoprotein chain [Hyphomicrobiales bacterium]|nr:sulfide dehydrogenase [flavocytochrome c] flavoprotein chain [Hyphomicrobiales bacterium]